MSFNEAPLKDLLGGKGYIRGPFGSALKRVELKEEGVPVYEQQHAIRGDRDFRYFIDEEKHEKLKRFTVETNDLIISCSGTVGRISVIREGDPKGIISQALLILRPDAEKVLPEYLYYFFSSKRGFNELINASQGAVQLNIAPRAVVEKIPVPLPSIEEQKTIIAILKGVDDKIELNRQTNQTLEHIAQAIFKSWFIDFEPTRAKIAAKQEWAKRCATPKENGNDDALLNEQTEASFIERAAMAAISGKTIKELDQLSQDQQAQLKVTAALFPDVLVDSELGDIPEGWLASTLGEHFNVVMGQSPKGDTYNEEGEGMLFFQGRRDFGFRYPTPRVYTTEPKRLAQVGDTLISVRAPVGDRNMANQECCLGRGVGGIRHKSGARSFTYAFIGHIESNLSNSGSDGTVFNSINKNELSNVGFVAPSTNLLNLYENKVESIDQRISINSNEIVALEELRDSLLPKLLSGELKLNQTNHL